MNTIRGLVFDWLFNASVQIGLFAILTAILSPFIAKAKAKYQHCFYLAIFALCLAAPVFNTLWKTRPGVVAERSQQQPIQGTEHPDHQFWIWNGLSNAHESTILAPGAWRENCAPCYLAGASSLSADPLQPRYLSSSSRTQRRFVDLSERNRDDWLRDRGSGSCCPS
jgi:hypothetical protein